MHYTVIGGSGFIGSALVRLLRSKGESVTIVDRMKSNDPLLADVAYELGDYGDRSFLERVLSATDVVIHLAYASVPKTSFEDPFSDIEHNLPPTLTLFQVAKSYPLKKLILLSSGGTVYGKVDRLPITENAPTNPISPYGITKLSIEKYGLMFHELYGLPVTILRPSNAYGEGQLPYRGQGFIATAVASILEDKEITVYGDTGTIRDYIHVDDLAHGIWHTVIKGSAGSVYNIGSGEGLTNQDILDSIARLAAKEQLTPRIVHEATRSFDVPANVLESTRLEQETGWSAQVSFDDGLERTWEWLKAHRTVWGGSQS